MARALILCLCLCLTPLFASAQTAFSVPTAGNTWAGYRTATSESIVTEDGVRGWRADDPPLYTYVYLNRTGELDLALDIRTNGGTAILQARVGHMMTA